GLGRLYGLFSYGSLPPQSRDEARASLATASQIGSTVDEYAEATSSIDQAQSLRDFDAKPLIVLTAGRGHDAEWLPAQDDMATLSTNSLHRVVADATHASLIEDEDDATATSEAIRDVVASVRTSTPLAEP
ncbi:MAG: alpha/beta fold hydrolase, partial [Vicinamibacterales bacterium]